MTWTVSLPWPGPDLSPNARLHWSKRHRAVKSAREDAWGITRAHVQRKLTGFQIDVQATFCPPDRRRRDRDNMIASAKALFDGVADAIGIDDADWRTSFRFSDPVPGGSVIITITPRETDRDR